MTLSILIILWILCSLSSVESGQWVREWRIWVSDVKLGRDIEVDCCELFLKVYIGNKDAQGHITRQDSVISGQAPLCKRDPGTYWQSENDLVIPLGFVEYPNGGEYNWMKIEYWEADDFLKWGDDYAGKTETRWIPCWDQLNDIPKDKNSKGLLVDSVVKYRCNPAYYSDGTIWDYNHNINVSMMIVCVITSLVVTAVGLMLLYCFKRKYNAKTYDKVMQSEEEESLQ